MTRTMCFSFASVLFLASPTRPLDVGRRDFMTTISAATQTQRWTPTALSRLSLDQAATFDRLDFARYPDPILRLEAKPVRRCDAALAKTVALLRAAARRHGAQGLAATQCGVDAAIVLLGDEAFVNPRIVERSPEARLRCWTERCLALPPDVRVETLRDETGDSRGHHGRGRSLHDDADRRGGAPSSHASTTTRGASSSSTAPTMRCVGGVPGDGAPRVVPRRATAARLGPSITFPGVVTSPSAPRAASGRAFSTSP